MLKTNLTIAFRNLWKYRGFTLVNVLGMSISLAGCLLIMLYVLHERSYDTWNKNADRVYRMNYTASKLKGEVDALGPGEVPIALKASMPSIQAFTRFYVFNQQARLVTFGDNSLYVEHPQGVDSTFFQVFPYTFIEGNPAHALDGPGSLVISEEVAARLFGKQPALGKMILWQAKTPMTVTGVFKTPSTPTHFLADAFRKLSSNGDGWGNGNFFTYLLVTPGTDRMVLQGQINRTLVKLPLNADTSFEGLNQIVLDPLKDVYFDSDISYDFAEHGNKHIPQILLAIAILLLTISCINFANFNITQSVRRARETGIRKVLGARRWRLALYYLLETCLLIFLSLLVAIIIGELLLPSLNHLLGIHLSLFGAGGIWELAGIVGIGLLVVIFSGGFVAYYVSGLEPTKVLKGAYSARGRGAGLRKTLLVAQFAFASLAVGALFVIHAQEKYMENLDPGFNKTQVLMVTLHKGLDHFDEVKQQLLGLPGVSMVSKANYLPGDKGMQVIGRTFNGQPVSGLDVVTVGYDFFQVMGMHILKGRAFQQSYGGDSTSYVVNETAERMFGLDSLLGHKWIDEFNVLGVVNNINQRGFETASEPTVYRVEGQGSNWANYILLKVDSKTVPATLNALTAQWKSIEPGFPPDYHFLDEQFNRMFLQYRQMDVIFMAFSALTLFIALLGIFVLSAFMALQRTKEIGIRKVLGSSVGGVIRLLNRDFVFLVLIADAIALPVLWFLAKQWLQGFAYRISLPWVAFIGTLVLTLVCTLGTVSIQAWKAAVADPAKALKYE